MHKTTFRLLLLVLTVAISTNAYAFQSKKGKRNKKEKKEKNEKAPVKKTY